MGKRHRPNVLYCSQKIVRCRLKVAESFETEGPPLACNTDNLDRRQCQIASFLQPLSGEWGLIRTDRNLIRGGAGCIESANPSYLLGHQRICLVQKQITDNPFAPQLAMRRQRHEFWGPEGSYKPLYFYASFRPPCFDAKFRSIRLLHIFVTP